MSKQNCIKFAKKLGIYRLLYKDIILLLGIDYGDASLIILYVSYKRCSQWKYGFSDNHWINSKQTVTWILAQGLDEAQSLPILHQF